MFVYMSVLLNKFYTRKSYNHVQKICEKLCKLEKSCKHKRNNGIWNKQLHYNYFQQLLTLRVTTWYIRKLGNLGERKWNTQTVTYYPLLPLKIPFYSYLVENSQKATLNFYFKSRFSAKPSKFSIYFAHDCDSKLFRLWRK